MQKLKFLIGSIVVLGLFVLLGYWAVTTMQSGSEHVNAQKIKALTDENADLKTQVDKLANELSTAQADAQKAQTTQPVAQPTPPTPKSTTPTTYKNQSLINDLQKLANSNVLLKLHSVGASVGTVQKFLNLYNKTSNKVDNDYGASTVTAITAFQKAQGITTSGQAGKTTFNSMIDWLKKQG